MKGEIYCLFLLQLFFITVSSHKPLDTSKTLTRIAFGSCAGLFGAKNPEVWQTILKYQPELYIWLGDAVYADKMYLPLMFTNSSETVWKAKYEEMRDQGGYKDLVNTTMITGIWDDHDYGKNNANKHFPYKEFSKMLYLGFLNEDENSPRYQHEGIYGAYKFGPKGQSVKLILLDNRWFNDPETHDVLGEEQWQFLENELKDLGDITIIANGLQVIVEDRFGINERWPQESVDRLMKLIQDKPVVLLSGDVHSAEIMKTTCSGRTIHEITSSGLTHTSYTQYGIGAPIGIALIYPFTYNISRRIFVKNFGTLDIEWSADPKFTFEVRKHDTGEVYGSVSFRASDLQKQVEPSYLCAQSPKERAIRHILSMLLVFVAPFWTPIVALVIFLRKYTNKD